MKFIENVFVAESIEDVNTVFHALKNNIPVFNTFLICFNGDSQNMAEILSAKEILKEKNREKAYIVIGVDGSRQEAYDLLRYIIQYACDKGWSLKELEQKITEE